MMSEAGYEILEHTADVGFRAWGPTPKDCFIQAGHAFLGIALGAGTVQGSHDLVFGVEGDGYADLLVNWLNELIYAIDSNKFAPRGVFVVQELSDETLVVHMVGCYPRDPEKQPWQLIVKAATYHDLEFVERNGRWEARVILDV